MCYRSVLRVSIGVRMHQRGECTLELGCTALATMIFLWFLFWLFRHLHWTLQWLVVACMVLWALSIAGYAVDVDRLCLEPLHNEFPDLARMLARARDRCSSALRRTGFGGVHKPCRTPAGGNIGHSFLSFSAGVWRRWFETGLNGRRIQRHGTIL
jgi:hypothetical protein|eukprot:COSAG01_NODE_417_length_17291_cov_610.598825_24_plen_155_part_00